MTSVHFFMTNDFMNDILTCVIRELLGKTIFANNTRHERIS